MSWSYKRLWHQLIDKNMSRTDLLKAAGISKNIYTKLAKNEPIAMSVLGKICNALNCNVEDVVEWVAEKENQE